MNLDSIKLESKMVCHMAFDTVHMMKYEHTITDAEVKFLIGRKFYSEHHTPKRKGQFGEFGKSKSYFYFEGTDKGKEYKTVRELLNTINP